MLHYCPQKAGLNINACACLHNMCIEHNAPGPAEDMKDIDYGVFEQNFIINEVDILNQGNADLENGRRLQRIIVLNHFN